MLLLFRSKQRLFRGVTLNRGENALCAFSRPKFHSVCRLHVAWDEQRTFGRGQEQTTDGYGTRQASGMSRKDKQDGHKKISWSTILLVVIMLVGIGVVAYPTVSDWWNSRHASRAIASYVEQVESKTDAERAEMLEAARAYNETLAQTEMNLNPDEDAYAEYEATLDISGTGIMGYVQIPTINVNLPIYHGTSDAVLQTAVGHIAGTSLPVGGKGTHAVLSGHRGLPSAKLFTDLDKLVEGDVFTITILDEVLTYQIDQIHIVLPEETGDLEIDPDQDYVTLVTCTPYGINTHRMLVRGHRIDNLETQTAVSVTPDAKRVSTMVVFVIVAVILTVVALVISFVRDRARSRRKSTDVILQEMEQAAALGGEEDETTDQRDH